MNDSNIIRMQELTFELEGLLKIASENPDRREVLMPLVADKLAAISDLLPQVDTRPATPPAPPAEYADDTDSPEPRQDSATPKPPQDTPEPEQDTPAPRQNTPEPEQPLPASTPTPTRRAPVFSINDRFFYARELFAGSLTDLEQSLKDITALDTYAEVEEYFYNDWGFDPESNVTADFLLIISRSFD